MKLKKLLEVELGKDIEHEKITRFYSLYAKNKHLSVLGSGKKIRV